MHDTILVRRLEGCSRLSCHYTVIQGGHFFSCRATGFWKSALILVLASKCAVFRVILAPFNSQVIVNCFNLNVLTTNTVQKLTTLFRAYLYYDEPECVGLVSRRPFRLTLQRFFNISRKSLYVDLLSNV